MTGGSTPGSLFPPRSAFIVLALTCGFALGAALSARPFLLARALGVAEPIGSLWLDALTMTVVPLVFGLLVTGISSAAGAAAAGGIARRAIVCFAVVLVAACALSAAFSSVALSLWHVNSDLGVTAQPPKILPSISHASWFDGIVPTNPVKAAADTAIVPLVVFAMLFGFALARISEPLREALANVIAAIVETMLVIVQWVLWLAPLGVFALAISVGARLGAGAASALLQYVTLVSLSCIAAGLMTAVAAMAIGGRSPGSFLRAALPAQSVAVGTQSSLASLPAMVQSANALGVRREVAAVVLPLAVSIFRPASAAANLTVAIYAAHMAGAEVPLQVLFVGVFVAASVSLAAVGLPAQVSFFASIAPVCVALGAPLTLLPVFLAVESVPDVFRTLGNVTSDLAVTRLVERWVR